MEDTWSTREIPVLAVVVEALEQTLSTRSPRGSEIADATGLSPEEVGLALIALEGEYLTLLRTFGPPDVWHVTGVTSNARRAVGQWPSPETLLSRVTAALEQVADDTEDPQTRSKLRQASTALAGLAQKVAVEVAAKLLEHQAGLG